jgi:hypothetical protein
MQGVKEKMSEAIKILEEVQFASFAHCRWCYRSQAVCEMWARSVNLQGRVVFKKKPGVDCRYGSWVLEAAAAFLVLGADSGLNIICRTRDGRSFVICMENTNPYCQA